MHMVKKSSNNNVPFRQRKKKGTVIPLLFRIMHWMQKYFAFQEPISFEYLNI